MTDPSSATGDDTHVAVCVVHIAPAGGELEQREHVHVEATTVQREPCP
jgi:hypothetical protein